mmetsp:Transcript_70893/g.148300  ORF Transcript_70893/g.148300 Transcript_70893/m.148300 type:complete len:557 (+) Transcript_70893:126-1796(+)
MRWQLPLALHGVSLLVNFWPGAGVSLRRPAFFSYENHGGDWDSGECASRERQSPIDFSGSAPWAALPKSSFYFDYLPLEGTLNILNTGHGISVQLENMGFGGIWFQGQYYSLTSATFHIHSEHVFLGKSKPMEMHIVHRNSETQSALVVAIPFDFHGDLGATYTKVGSNVMCDNALGRQTVMTTTSARQCEEACSRRPGCMAFVTVEGNVGSSCSTCTIYEGSDCSLPLQVPSSCSGNVSAYNKNVVTTQSYLGIGAGKCTPGEEVAELGTSSGADRQVALWSCQENCSATKDCRFISVSEKSKCAWYSGAATSCADRPTGRDLWETFQKVEGDGHVGLSQLLGVAPLPKMGKVMDHPLPMSSDILSNFLDGGTYFEYQGSLTSPPCTERATWLVRREALKFSRSQHDQLRDRIYEATSEQGNYRAVMPLMGRTITAMSAVRGTPPPPSNSTAPGGQPAAPAPAPAGPLGGDLPLIATATAEEALAWAARADKDAAALNRELKAIPPFGLTNKDIPHAMAVTPALQAEAQQVAPAGLAAFVAGNTASIRGLLRGQP